MRTVLIAFFMRPSLIPSASSSDSCSGQAQSNLLEWRDGIWHPAHAALSRAVRLSGY